MSAPSGRGSVVPMQRQKDPTEDDGVVIARIAGSYDGRPSARAFLVGIAAQLVRQSARKRARWTIALTELGHTFARAVGATPEARAMVTEELATADAVLNGLSEEKRIVFSMIESEGLSGEEVAAALGIPAATVWTRLHYARLDLRRTLAKRGIQ